MRKYIIVITVGQLWIHQPVESDNPPLERDCMLLAKALGGAAGTFIWVDDSES